MRTPFAKYETPYLPNTCMHACMQVWVHVAMCMRTLHHPQRPFPLSARVLTQARGGRGRMTFGVGTWAVRVQWLFFCNILLFFGMWLFEPMCPLVACMQMVNVKHGDVF